MLDERGVKYHYREYTEEPLSKAEVQQILKLLRSDARSLLRRNDKVFKDLRLTGEETEEKLVSLMAAHPTLLQRPIGIKGKKAVVGRPPENLLTL